MWSITITPSMPLPSHLLASPHRPAQHPNEQAADKTSSSVNKAAKDVKKAVNNALSTKDDDDKLLKGVALAVPVVALAVCVGVYLWKEKPWQKKGGKPTGAK